MQKDRPILGGKPNLLVSCFGSWINRVWGLFVGFGGSVPQTPLSLPLETQSVT